MIDKDYAFLLVIAAIICIGSLVSVYFDREQDLKQLQICAQAKQPQQIKECRE